METFLDNCVEIRKDTDPDIEVEIFVVDNSERNQKGIAFVEDMEVMCESRNIKYLHLDVPVDHAAPIHNKIATSANYLTDYALQHNFDYIMILECDVIPGTTSLNKLVRYAQSNNYSAVMGAYYAGYTYTKFKTEKDSFFLTGIVLMNMEIFKQGLRWRYDYKVLGALPDAHMGHDLRISGFKVGFHPQVFSLHLGDGQPNPIGRPGSGWQNI